MPTFPFLPATTKLLGLNPLSPADPLQIPKCFKISDVIYFGVGELKDVPVGWEVAWDSVSTTSWPLNSWHDLSCLSIWSETPAMRVNQSQNWLAGMCRQGGDLPWTLEMCPCNAQVQQKSSSQAQSWQQVKQFLWYNCTVKDCSPDLGRGVCSWNPGLVEVSRVSSSPWLRGTCRALVEKLESGRAWWHHWPCGPEMLPSDQRLSSNLSSWCALSHSNCVR